MQKIVYSTGQITAFLSLSAAVVALSVSAAAHAADHSRATQLTAQLCSAMADTAESAAAGRNLQNQNTWITVFGTCAEQQAFLGRNRY